MRPTNTPHGIAWLHVDIFQNSEILDFNFTHRLYMMDTKIIIKRKLIEKCSIGIQMFPILKTTTKLSLQGFFNIQKANQSIQDIF